MDYKTIIDSNTLNYKEYYEVIINNILDGYVCKDVLDILAKKRKIGIEKYGDHSFQAGFEVSMKAPSGVHALEELQDAMNYVAHEIYKARNIYSDSDIVCSYESILGNLAEIYSQIGETLQLCTECEKNIQKKNTAS